MNPSVVTGPQRAGATTPPQRGEAKTARIPIKVEAATALPKPDWIRVRVSQGERFREVHAACRPLVRSSHHADRQTHAAGV